MSLSSGNTYTLDADMSGFEVERIYFPRGGWLDFLFCELDSDFTGMCEDEEGNEWEFLGES